MRISTTSDNVDDTTPIAESEKAGLKLNIEKLRSWHPVPSLRK